MGEKGLLWPAMYICYADVTGVGSEVESMFKTLSPRTNTNSNLLPDPHHGSGS